MEVRRYSHIMHMESTVIGTIAEDCTALDVVLAAFPAGTLSGAPKVRAMEIIDELEITRRGLYGGVVGYLDFAGDADAAIHPPRIRRARTKPPQSFRPSRWRRALSGLNRRLRRPRPNR